MLAGVSITCFASSYLVAFVLEISRLVFRSGIRGAALLGFAGAGLFAHTVFLVHRALQSSGAPLSSQQDWYLLSAWVLVAGYLGLTCRQRKNVVGLFLLPLVLMLVGAAWFADATPFAREPAVQLWGLVHGVSILLATIAVLVGFILGLMYVFQTYLLKKKRALPRGLRLPSLEWLQRNNGRAIALSAPLMGLGVVGGVVLNVINEPERVPWFDPLTLSTLVAFVWLLAVSLISAFYRTVRQGRKIAYLTLANFLILAFALIVGLQAGTRHRRASTESLGRSPSGPAIVTDRADSRGALPRAEEDHA
jgi:ABC-type transport system involved in cytochrome c biogenesis permease subunit